MSLGACLEFLISEGHSQNDLLHSSPEKIRWLYSLAIRRRSIQDAAFDLRSARSMKITIASLFDEKKNGKHWRQFEKTLLAIISGPVNQDASTNRRRMADSLKRLGAKIK